MNRTASKLFRAKCALAEFGLVIFFLISPLFFLFPLFPLLFPPFVHLARMSLFSSQGFATRSAILSFVARRFPSVLVLSNGPLNTLRRYEVSIIDTKKQRVGGTRVPSPCEIRWLIDIRPTSQPPLPLYENGSGPRGFDFKELPGKREIVRFSLFLFLTRWNSTRCS